MDVVELSQQERSEPLRICVTGATGYVAGWIVLRLLAAGHTVHATCRNPYSKAAVGHLLAMPGAAERLKLFQANLLAPGAFDEAVAGCDVVIHTASPYALHVPRGARECGGSSGRHAAAHAHAAAVTALAATAAQQLPMCQQPGGSSPTSRQPRGVCSDAAVGVVAQRSRRQL